MKDSNAYENSKRNLQKRLRKIIANCDDLRTDIYWWNENRLDAPPFDADPDLVLADLARQMLGLVNADQPIPQTLMRRLNEQAIARASA